jgi:hypothetical protein
MASRIFLLSLAPRLSQRDRRLDLSPPELSALATASASFRKKSSILRVEFSGTRFGRGSRVQLSEE